VTREDCVLRIRFGQKTERLVDNFVESGDHVQYQYEGVLTNTEFHIVAVFFYEGGAYELIGPKGRTHLTASPILSPDRQRIVAGSRDLEAGYVPNLIQIWNIAGGSPRLEFQMNTDPWGASNLKWIDAKTIQLDQDSLEERGFREITRKGAHLRQTSTGWSFEPAKGK
jgi:hypothetical protein